jgi:hypothetical protein
MKPLGFNRADSDRLSGHSLFRFVAIARLRLDLVCVLQIAKRQVRQPAQQHRLRLHLRGQGGAPSPMPPSTWLWALRRTPVFLRQGWLSQLLSASCSSRRFGRVTVASKFGCGRGKARGVVDEAKARELHGGIGKHVAGLACFSTTPASPACLSSAAFMPAIISAGLGGPGSGVISALMSRSPIASK